jgi:hypothetical protein
MSEPRSKRSRKNLIDHIYGPLGSVLLHVLIVFALLKLVKFETAPETFETEVQMVEMEIVDIEELEELKQELDELELPEMQMDISMEEDVSVPEAVSDFQANDPDLDVNALDVLSDVTSPLVLKGLFAGRSAAGRSAMMRKFGASKETEDAVMRSLRWLKTTQEVNGSWTALSGGAPPSPPGELYKGTPEAFTALAILSFLAHGETPSSREFGPTVEKALRWLLDQQKEGGLFGIGFRHGTDLGYTHLIVTYALCEAAAITRIPAVLRSAEKALQRIIDGQLANGGWDYAFKKSDRADVSLISWCVQALKAGQLAGLNNPGLEEAMVAAGKCLTTTLYQQSGIFLYDTTKKSLSRPIVSGLTSVGVLSLQIIGDPASDRELAQSSAWLAKNARFSWNEPWGRSPLYYLYYTTQAMFRMGGNTWNAWNRQFAPEVVAHQIIVKDQYEWDGKKYEIGYWGPVNNTPPNLPEYCQAYVYNTALCSLSLMVYYRYLPLYRDAMENIEETSGGSDDVIITIR